MFRVFARDMWCGKIIICWDKSQSFPSIQIHIQELIDTTYLWYSFSLIGAGAVLGKPPDVVHFFKYTPDLAQSAVNVLLCAALWSWCASFLTLLWSSIYIFSCLSCSRGNFVCSIYINFPSLFNSIESFLLCQELYISFFRESEPRTIYKIYAKQIFSISKS